MRVLLQRVENASVEVEGRVVGAIEAGILGLVGFTDTDSEASLKPMAEKILNLRIFSNEDGRFDRSLLDVRGGLLLVSQFTLYADCTKGRRPDFGGAMKPEKAKLLFEAFLNMFPPLGLSKVESGIFGAHMKIDLKNDGPVTIMLET